MGAIMNCRVGVVKYGRYVAPLSDCQHCRSLYLTLGSTVVTVGTTCLIFKICILTTKCKYMGADKSLARPTSRCILFMLRIFHFILVLFYI